MFDETMLRGEILEYYLDNVPAYVYVKDATGNYRYLNKSAERLFNVKRSDLGRVREYTDYDFFCKEEADSILAVDRVVMETGERTEVKHMLGRGMNTNGENGGGENGVRQSNSYDGNDDDGDARERCGYTYLTLKFPLRNGDGTVVGVCGFSHDVTDRSRAETTTHRTALRKSENRFRSLFQHIQSALALHEIVTDGAGGPAVDYVFVEVNEAFEEMTGLKAENIVGRLASEVFPDGHAMVGEERIRRYGAVAQSGTVEQFKEYSEPLAKWHMGLAFRPQENEFVTLFVDITERMEIEEALRQSEERHRNLFESMMQGAYRVGDNECVWPLDGFDPY